MGGWYGGLAAIAPGAAPLSDSDMAVAVRNNALATAVALLIGLTRRGTRRLDGLGEPMTFTHHRTRDRVAA